jgi:hypothetical protein
MCSYYMMNCFDRALLVYLILIALYFVYFFALHLCTALFIITFLYYMHIVYN